MLYSLFQSAKGFFFLPFLYNIIQIISTEIYTPDRFAHASLYVSSIRTTFVKLFAALSH